MVYVNPSSESPINYFDIDGVRQSHLITLTKFATPQDITLDELTIELFYPADDATDAALRKADSD